MKSLLPYINMPNTQMVIYGELHHNQRLRKEINDNIRAYKPDVILHELLYEDECHAPVEIRKRLNRCGVGNTCDPRLNRDVYELGLELKAILVGIDLEAHTSFEEREAHMLEKLLSWLETGKRCAVVVGDTHLRQRRSRTLGAPSVIATKLKHDSRVTIVRAPRVFQEMD